MNLICKSSILNLIKNIKILDLISKYLHIKKIGTHYLALCPFHADKNPSFLINEEDKFYYCFACQNTGNIIHFMRKFHNYTFIHAVKEIASIYNIQLEYESKYKYSKYIPTQENSIKNFNSFILNKINNFFISELNKNNLNIIDFLKKEKLTLKSIENFNIGYCPGDKNKLQLFLNTLKKQEILKLIELGIIKYYNKTKNTFCIFQNRIIFPLVDSKNQLLGFGGKNISLMNFVKYLNSPNNLFFKKQNILYGLYQLLKHNYSPKKILVVEGYLDVISLHQAGIYYAVGLLGSNLSNYQLDLLLNITKNITFCYDGDEAGKKASWITLTKIISYIKDEHQINFIFLPDKEDPNSLIQKETKMEFESRIDNAIPFVEFLFNNLYKNIIKHNNVYEKMTFINTLLKFISKIPSKNFKSYLMYKLKQKIEFFEEYFSDEYKNDKYNMIHTFEKPNTPTFLQNLFLLINIFIKYPKYSKIAFPLLKFLNNINNIYIKFFIFLVINVNKNNFYEQIENYYKIDTSFSKKNYLIFLKKISLFTNNFVITETKIKAIVVDLLKFFYKISLKNKLSKLRSLENTIGLTKKNKEEIWKLNKKIYNLKNNKALTCI